MGEASFTASKAVRDKVPLLMGIVGPTGTGKTFSALRLAKGMQSVRGGRVLGIDTESKRMKHYADYFDFDHAEFHEPFGSLRYLEACRWAVRDKGAQVVIIDSASHEHEGVGGYLDLHRQEINRLAGDDIGKQKRVQFLAWARPSAERRTFINGLLQLNAAFIFCFRAKEKLDIKPGRDPIEMGWMAIAGDEFLYEMGCIAVFEPGANGVPTWKSDMPGTARQIKIPLQFRDVFKQGEQLSEKHGEALARWAEGTSAPPPAPPPPAGEAGFRFTMTMKGDTKSTPDGDLWARTMVAQFESKPYDFIKRLWVDNKAHVEAAYAAGHSEFARRVEAAYKARVKGEESSDESETAFFK